MCKGPEALMHGRISRDQHGWREGNKGSRGGAGPSQPSHGPRPHPLLTAPGGRPPELTFSFPILGSLLTWMQGSAPSTNLSPETQSIRCGPWAAFSCPAPSQHPLAAHRVPTAGPQHRPVVDGPPSLWPGTPPSEETRWLLPRSHDWPGEGNHTSCPRNCPCRPGHCCLLMATTGSLVSCCPSEPRTQLPPRGPSVKQLLSK